MQKSEMCKSPNQFKTTKLGLVEFVGEWAPLLTFYEKRSVSDRFSRLKENEKYSS